MISESKQEILVKKFVVGLLAANCYLIYEKSSGEGVLIDPGTYDVAIQKYIEKHGIKINCIVNTHGHADHIMGDAYFNYPVMIHKLDAECLSDPYKSLSYFTEGNFKPVKASRLLADGDVVLFGSSSLTVLHTPGHTAGSVSLKCGDVVFSGDALFQGSIGRTDLPGSSYDALIDSITKKLLTLPDKVRVFPGHGPETTIGDERRDNPFL
ncbi:MAG: MBL fold metallo-hydrolase [Candidatus Omnitrophica bacterium]|nr:MBL fold metallo-hydrolase [Candidatus Omnitrophota bacterium]